MNSQTLFERKNNRLVLTDGVFMHNIPAIFDIPRMLHMMGMNHPMVVSGKGLDRSNVDAELEHRGLPYTHFDGFSPNPTSDQVLAGWKLYQEKGCDGLLSIGGGSAMDVAKCIKAISGTSEADDVKTRFANPMPTEILHVAMPTTAGTGSEATRFATLYIDGEKHSIRHDALLPEIVVLDPTVLATLPAYQRASTMLDALVQGVESYWSAKADAQSRPLAAQAIQLVATYGKEYLTNPENIDAANAILVAAYLSGKAINLTTTTAAHAMCYKLTSYYGLAHGHAAALCLESCWRVLLDEAAQNEELSKTLREIAEQICADCGASAEDGLVRYLEMLDMAQFPTQWAPADDAVVPELAASVNVERLSNFPLTLTSEAIESMYRSLLNKAREA